MARADRQVRDALGHLRRLAHGTFPPSLAAEGIDAALEDLVASSPMPITVSGRLGPLPPPLASGVYAVTAAVLEAAAGARSVSLRLERADHEIRIGAGVGGAAGDLDLVSATDRAGALDGALAVTRDDAGDGTMVTVVIPCGS
jgi:signal transduction histidine kinase